MVDLQVQQLGLSPIYLNVLLQTAMASVHKTKSLFVLPAGHLRGQNGSDATIAVWIKQPICRAYTLKEKGFLLFSIGANSSSPVGFSWAIRN